MTPLFFAQAATDHAAGTLFGLGFFVLFLIALYAVVWLYCVINAATRSDFDTGQRVIWILALLFLHGLGPILYLILAGRKSA